MLRWDRYSSWKDSSWKQDWFWNTDFLKMVCFGFVLAKAVQLLSRTRVFPNNQHWGLLQQPLEPAAAGSLHPHQQALVATPQPSLAVGASASCCLSLAQCKGQRGKSPSSLTKKVCVNGSHCNYFFFHWVTEFIVLASNRVLKIKIIHLI